MDWVSRQQATYDALADEYAARIYDELRGKPFDRQWLAEFADAVRGQGVVCDMGCGPGHVARFLKDCGADVVGVDLSEGMLAQARRLNPDIAFAQGNMLALDVADGAWAGIVAFYSVIHLPRERVTEALREFWRVLGPGGLLLVAFHLGDEIVHLDELWGRAIAGDWVFFQLDEMERDLRAASFDILKSQVREPYEGVEHASRRGYILARKALSRPGES